MRCRLRNACVSSKGFFQVGKFPELRVPLEPRCSVPPVCDTAVFRSNDKALAPYEELGVLLTPTSSHFGHHILEGLFPGVIQMMLWNETRPDAVFLTKQNGLPMQWELVTNRSTELRREWRCFRTLLVGPGRTGCVGPDGEFPLGIFERARDYIVSQNVSRSIIPPGVRPGLVVIQQGDWRRIENLDAVKAVVGVVTGLPIEVIHMQHMTMVEQVNSVRRASIFIAVTASATGNALWMRDGCVHLQIAPDFLGMRLEYIFDKSLAVRYVATFNHTASKVFRNVPRDADRDVAVNMASFTDGLRLAMAFLSQQPNACQLRVKYSSTLNPP